MKLYLFTDEETGISHSQLMGWKIWKVVYLHLLIYF